ncbi:MAG: hypothetical protein O8C66_12180 [Candidatus Methanoperedens sp.]|nr:hypothetical protein [Candidatus Methanoperedens sp.]MCZ7371257.1 hypothetical protein [Candidatus Methanoperedens sp.]
MKLKKEKPKYGPENIPVITPEKIASEIADKLAGKKESLVEGVMDIKCPPAGTVRLMI